MASPVFGQAVSASVNPNDSTVTGNVAFLLDGTVIQSGTSDSLNIPAPDLTVGTHTLSVNYGGDSTHLAGTNLVSSTFTVAPDMTNVSALTASSTSAVPFQVVNLTATVTNTSTGSTAMPTGGIVDFINNGTSLGTVEVINGSASLPVSFPQGSDHIIAVYDGTTNFYGSSSGTNELVVNVNPVTPTLSMTSNKLLGQPDVLTVTVSGYGTPTGTLSFTDGTTPLGSATLSGGTAVFSWTPTTSGTHNITVSYSGDTDNSPASLTQPVSFLALATQIEWATPAAITYGTALSSTQLDATAGFLGLPAPDKPLSFTPVAGTFAYTPSAGTVLSAGTQTLSVTFTPTDTGDYGSATDTVQLSVNKATPSITWANPADINFGTPLSATQLDASANVPGTFSYSSPVGTVLSAGAEPVPERDFHPRRLRRLQHGNGHR